MSVFPLKRGVMVPVVSLSVVLFASVGAPGCGDDESDGVAAGTGDAGAVPTTRATSTSTGTTEGGPGPSLDPVEDSGAPALDAGVAQAVRFSHAPNGPDRLYGVAFDAAGNAFSVGNIASSADSGEDAQSIVVKFTAAGALDATFGDKGIAKINLGVGTTAEVTRGIAVQSDGKIVIAGTIEHAGAIDARDRDMVAARLTTTGVLDTTFGSGGIKVLDLGEGAVNGSRFSADAQWGLALGASDVIFVAGARKATARLDTDFTVVKLTKDGAYDEAFADKGVFSLDIGNLNASGRVVTALADGSVLASGYMTDADNVIRPVVYKLTALGVLDSTFATNGVFNEIVLETQAEAYAAVAQGTSFVTTGYGKKKAADPLDIVSFRLNDKGVFDTTYGTNGVAQIDLGGLQDQSRALLVLPDQRIVFVGGGQKVAGNQDALIAVYKANGTPDTSVGPNGIRTFDLGGDTADFFWNAALSPDGKRIAVVGVGGPKGDAGTGNDDTVVFFASVP